MGLGTITGTAARIRRTAAAVTLLDTVLFTVVQVGTTALDLRVPIVHIVQGDTVLFGYLDTTITTRNYSTY